MQKILTPILTETLIQQLDGAGYHDNETEHYPLVAQLDNILLFVVYDFQNDSWIVSNWDVSKQDFRYDAYAYCDTFEQALLAFTNTHQDLLLSGE
jgi:hypothetical protein